MDKIIIDGLSFGLPLFIIAIAGIYSERSGVINLALEGLQGMGAFAGALLVVLLTIHIPPDTTYLPYLAILAAAVGGAVYALIHAVLCIKFKANQVISGVVVNILAVSLTAFLTSQINQALFQKPSNKFMLNVFPRYTVPVISDIPILGAFFTEFYTFEVIIIGIALVSYYVLYSTKFGMRLRACGENPQAIDACGVSVAKIRYFAIILSGALAGVGGICFAYSISANFSSSIYFGAGYLAIAALIFGNWKILPTFATCMLFGFSRSGGYFLSGILKLPSTYSNLVSTLPYILTLLLLVFFSKSNRPPKALGEAYDKGKR